MVVWLVLLAAAVPLANMTTMSLVEVSPSMEMQLYDLSAATERSRCSASGVTGASVQMMPRVVAILGWTIPAPLVIPAMENVVFGEECRVNLRETSLGKVSVVQRPLAASSQWAWELPVSW